MQVQISTFNTQQHETAKSKTIVKRTALLADATNAKNPFMENALPVYNVCAQAANKILTFDLCFVVIRTVYHMFS